MSSPATLCYLIRHADYDLLGRVLAGRQPGHGLSTLGHVQAAAVAEVLAAEDIAAVVSSPLQRAQETAGPIAARHGLSVATDERLNEIDFGEWTGLGFNELHARSGWGEFNRFRGASRPPGGESMASAQARAADCVLAHMADSVGRSFVVVSHSDVIKAVLCLFLGNPLDLMRRLEVAPASRSVVAFYPGDCQIVAINLPPPTRAVDRDAR